MRSRTITTVVGLLTLAGLGTVAHAANYPLQWLDHSPTAFGNVIPNNSNYVLPGIGNVNITYTIPTTYTQARNSIPQMQNGTIVNGPDTYTWAPHENFATTAQSPNGTIMSSWDITYTFSGVIPAGTIYLGVMGLGQTTSFGGATSTATVLQNGTYLGEWDGGAGFGSNVFSGGPGVFSLQNSQTGAGGSNPWWNTQLALVRIDDAVSSFTVRFNQINGDGVGVNIAVVPTPASAALLGLGGLIAARRRRA